ncbi:MAG: hypothetical protein ABWY00_10885, partial [Dongiaceae bacterium]
PGTRLRVCRDLLTVIALCWCVTADPPVAAADQAGKIVKLSAEDQQEINSLLGAGVVGQALPARALLAPESYMTDMKAAVTFQVRDDEGNVSSEIHNFAKAPAGESATGWQYSIAGKRRDIFEKAADGSLTTIREYDLDKKVVSQFSPGEPLILPGLKPGESRQVKIQVQVADIDDPTNIDYNGKLDVTYTYLGRFRVTVPAGSYDANLIKWTYRGKIGPARIKTAQYRFISEKGGMVAMIEWRNISAMLVYHDNTRQGKQLTTAN